MCLVLHMIVPYSNMCNLFPFQHFISCDTVIAGGVCYDNRSGIWTSAAKSPQRQKHHPAARRGALQDQRQGIWQHRTGNFQARHGHHHSNLQRVRRKRLQTQCYAPGQRITFGPSIRKGFFLTGIPKCSIYNQKEFQSFENIVDGIKNPVDGKPIFELNMI